MEFSSPIPSSINNVKQTGIVKLLLFQAERFSFTSNADFESRHEHSPEQSVEKAVVVFAHVEACDEERLSSVVNKSTKTIKWLSNKRDLKTVVLHSFAHLSESNATADFAHNVLLAIDAKLTRANFEVIHTPFGESCAWDLRIYGDRLAKVFKTL